jgi:hypothetical protein
MSGDPEDSAAVAPTSDNPDEGWTQAVGKDGKPWSFKVEPTGPLNNHKRYIELIALQNATEYYDLVKADQERPSLALADRYKELRYLLNAIESINNIPEYLYFDTHPAHANPTPDEFRARLLRENECLSRIADVANAYKHCVRGKTRDGAFRKSEEKQHAAELARHGVRIEIKEVAGTVQVTTQEETFEVDRDAVEALEAAFRFWVAYVNGEVAVSVV